MGSISVGLAGGPLFGVRTLALLLAGALLVFACLRPVEAQGLGVFGGITRPIADSWKRIVSEPQRFRIRPKLIIDPQRQVGATTTLSADKARRLILAVHGDGAAYLWDLERGVRVGGRLGSGVVAGVVRGAGRSTEIVAIHGDGSVSALRLDGERRVLGTAIRGFDAGAAPMLSGNGAAMAFRTHDGRWHVATMGTRPVALPDAAGEARPLLSPDGSTVVYHAASGALIVGQIARSGVRVLGLLDGCEGGVAVTVGVFTPVGTRVVLGDARGGLCAWTLVGAGAPRRLFTVRTKQLGGAVGALAMSRDGSRVAVRGLGGLVEVWAVSGKVQRLASVKLSPGAARPLVLDTSRRWVFGGEADGTIAIHSLERQEVTTVGLLISTARGWTVLDRAGRFDGSQGGVDALTWSGETATRIRQDLPVDAFSESYFEPGLLAKLSAPGRSDYLTAEVDDLSNEGYLRPPRVVIDPIPADGRVVGESVSVTVRQAETDYPLKLLSEIRLYHNAKLVPDGQLVKADGLARFTVRLASGRNDFRALGIGYRGIEGQPSPVRTVAVSAAPSRPELRLVAIGINDYERPDWELSYPRNDAQTFVSALHERGGGLFADTKAATLLDASADKSTIEARILAAAKSAHDVLVVYYSGHGYAFREEHGWEWYLLPFTSEWKRGASSQADFDAQIRRFGLSSKRLMHLLTHTRAQRVFLVLDACQSGAVAEAFETFASPGRGGGLDDAVAQKSLRRMARVGGIHILAASRAHEDAKELQVVPHGALTYLVIEGIRGAADGAGDQTGDGQVSVREIVDYAVREMPALAHRLVQEPISQIPVGYSRGSDFALAEL